MVEMTETSNEKLITRTVLLVMVSFQLFSWIPAFGLPLGDSHEGRVLGQFSLHMKNFWSMGAVSSSFGASWEPFSDIPYTHHPPALTFLHIVVSTLIGEGLKQIKLISYAAGIVTIPALYWMGRKLGIHAKPVIISVLLLLATPWWWVYGRLGLGLLPNILMIGTIWSATLSPTRRRLLFASLATFFAIAASWHGVFLMPFLWFYVWRKRKFDRLTLSLIGAAVMGGLVILIWVSQGGGFTEFGEHFGERVERDWTWGEFVRRQWNFGTTLLPLWYTILALPALLLGAIDLRTRYLTVSLTLMVLAFAIVPSNGAWIHDYWNFSILLALFPGFAVLGEWVTSLIKENVNLITQKTKKLISPTIFLLLPLALLINLQPQHLHDDYFVKRSEAGRLVSEAELTDGQRVAWHLPQVPWPTWVSHKWDLPTSSLLNAQDLGTVPPGEMILLRVDRLPDWIDSEIESVLERRRGDYGLVKASVMKNYATGIQK